MNTKRMSAGLICVALFSTGCANDRSATLSSGAPNEPVLEETVPAGPAIPDCRRERVSYLQGTTTLNGLSTGAAAAVIGTIERLDPPRRVELAHGDVFFVGDAFVKAERVVFDSDGARFLPGDVVPVRLWATDTCGPESYTEMSGHIEQGQRMVVMLSQGEHDFGGPKPEQVFELTAASRSVWRVEKDERGADSARSEMPNWSGPLEDLVQRVQSERAAGRQPYVDPESEGPIQ
jgi:hypothetical protein